VTDHELLEILYEAYNSDLGLVVTTSDPERFRQRCYAARKVDPDLECLSFVTSPTAPNSEIWILNNGKAQETHDELSPE